MTPASMTSPHGPTARRWKIRRASVCHRPCAGRKRPAVEGLSGELKGKIDVIVQALAGRKTTDCLGTNAGSIEVIQAAANVAKALKGRGADVGVTMVAARSTALASA